MFKCIMCGECCRNLNKSKLYDDLDRGDGVCKYLVDNLCSIYDNRPLLCRVDESYYAFFKGDYSLEEYYNLNYLACKKIQKKRGS